MSNILEQFKITGKVAVVTGAGRGLGQGMAIALAEAGADILAVDIIDATETKARVEALGCQCVTFAGDITEAGKPEEIAKRAVTELGRLDILLNNAGIIRRADFLEFSEKDWDDVMDLNIKAVFLLSQAAARQMVAQKQGGKIISIASMLSFQGGIRVPSYTSSKSAVMGLTRLMACELGPMGIQCNAIAPGYMATDNTTALRADVARNQAILDRIPVGRWGNPEDLAGAVVFLASSASDYVNGLTLAVDGGWLAR
jgi:2-deoxy-D-gluconate 3-dehydrogenase